MQGSNPPFAFTRRVLIIDDNEDGGKMLSLVLQALGCATRVAFSGEEGLRAGDGFEPDLVLIDLGMVPMDGHETCVHMRRLPWGAAAHIIAYTGRSLETEYDKARDAGFDGYLLKPIQKATMIELLEGRGTANWAVRPYWLDVNQH
jgi:two-component system CheB/CheR fusion protein